MEESITDKNDFIDCFLLFKLRFTNKKQSERSFWVSHALSPSIDCASLIACDKAGIKVDCYLKSCV